MDSKKLYREYKKAEQGYKAIVELFGENDPRAILAKEESDLAAYKYLSVAYEEEDHPIL